MLKQRIITGIVLVALFLSLLLFASPQLFCLITGLIVIRGAWEWTLLMGLKSFLQCLTYLLLVVLAAGASLLLYIPCVLTVSVLGWVLALFLVISYPKLSDCWGRGVFWRGVMGFWILIPCWLAINEIRNLPNGIYILLYLFVLIWGADIGAYFAGKKWGRTKLAPEVSPGKSRQGLYGALVVTFLIALGGLWLFNVPKHMMLPVLVLSMLTVLFSVLGDLFESMLKRRQGLKDSGNLLPGHGGLLDRIDSLTAAAPLFALGLFTIAKIYH